MITIRSFLSLSIVLSVVLTCRGAKILNVVPVSSRSHYILGRELMRSIADAGHDVTYVSAFSEVYTPKNASGSYKEIELTGGAKEVEEFTKNMNLFELDKTHPLVSVLAMAGMSVFITEMSLKHPKFQALIKSGEKFDVVIMEQFADDAFKCLAPHFGAHLILYSPMGPSYSTNEATGNPASPSYHADMFLRYPSRMNFWQRTTNFVFNIVQTAITRLHVYPQQNKLVKKYISEDLDLYDSLNNQSLVLINTHVSISHAKPLVPQMVFIGGFHVKPEKKLPKDLQEYLDNSKEGVVLFSLGSVAKSTSLPVEKRDALLRTFAKLKENVLWKWEDETLDGKPDNVKISKWLPQADILSHPNVKLFITHCGHGSFTETLAKGKPIVGMPIFGDQTINALTAVDLGVGVRVSYHDLTEETLTAAVREVLDNPRYAENAKFRSAVYRDRKVSAVDEAIYWIEYVIKYNGAPHLRVSYLDMPWYQYYLVDVALFILSITLGSIWIVTKIINKLLSLRCKSKKLKKN